MKGAHSVPVGCTHSSKLENLNPGAQPVLRASTPRKTGTPGGKAWSPGPAGGLDRLPLRGRLGTRLSVPGVVKHRAELTRPKLASVRVGASHKRQSGLRLLGASKDLSV
jgi:hypothetical protein